MASFRPHRAISPPIPRAASTMSSFAVCLASWWFTTPRHRLCGNWSRPPLTGAQDPAIEGVEVLSTEALHTTAEDVLAADGYVLNDTCEGRPQAHLGESTSDNRR
jgi:hypothetical protein